MAKARVNEVELLGQTIEYAVSQSSDASKPRIDVDIHGVTVIVPDLAEIQPKELLQENAVWVVEKQREFDQHREKIPDRTFEEGEVFPLLGAGRELVVEPAQSHTVTDSSIRLRKSTVEQSTVKQVLENVYRRKAREHFSERADLYADQMGVEYGKIEIRNQRTKWGSCSTTGTISLNWRLLMAPPDVVDYVVIHELAHLQEPNHDSAFWSLVSQYDPEYEAHSEWLAENSAKLVFSEEDL
jgi:predicted metal-dependent hydrolase